MEALSRALRSPVKLMSTGPLWCQALLAGLAGTLLAGPALAAEPAGSWAPTDPPAAARSEHTATPLPDGSVLVAGGADSGGTPLAAVELYEPSGGRWKLAPFLAIGESSTVPR